MECLSSSDDEVFMGPVTAKEIESLWRYRMNKKKKLDKINHVNSVEEHIVPSSVLEKTSPTESFCFNELNCKSSLEKDLKRIAPLAHIEDFEDSSISEETSYANEDTLPIENKLKIGGHEMTTPCPDELEEADNKEKTFAEKSMISVKGYDKYEVFIPFSPAPSSFISNDSIISRETHTKESTLIDKSVLSVKRDDKYELYIPVSPVHEKTTSMARNVSLDRDNIQLNSTSNFEEIDLFENSAFTQSRLKQEFSDSLLPESMGILENNKIETTLKNNLSTAETLENISFVDESLDCSVITVNKDGCSSNLTSDCGKQNFNRSELSLSNDCNQKENNFFNLSKGSESIEINKEDSTNSFVGGNIPVSHSNDSREMGSKRCTIMGKDVDVKLNNAFDLGNTNSEEHVSLHQSQNGGIEHNSCISEHHLQSIEIVEKVNFGDSYTMHCTISDERDSPCKFEITDTDVNLNKSLGLKNDLDIVVGNQVTQLCMEETHCEVTSSKIPLDCKESVNENSDSILKLYTNANFSTISNGEVLEVSTSGLPWNEDEKISVSDIDCTTKPDAIGSNPIINGSSCKQNSFPLDSANVDLFKEKSSDQETSVNVSENDVSSEKLFVSFNENNSNSSMFISRKSIDNETDLGLIQEDVTLHRNQIADIDNLNEKTLEGKVEPLRLETNGNFESNILKSTSVTNGSNCQLDYSEKVNEIKGQVKNIDLNDTGIDSPNISFKESVETPVNPIPEEMEVENSNETESSEKSFVSVVEEDMNSEKQNCSESVNYVPPDKKQCTSRDWAKENEKKSKIPIPGMTRLPVLKPSSLKVENLKDSVWASDFRKKKIPLAKKPDYIVSPGKLDQLLKCPSKKLIRPNSAGALLQKPNTTPLQSNTRLFNESITKARPPSASIVKMSTPRPKSGIPKLSKTIGDTPAQLKTPPKNPKYKDIASPVATYIKSSTSVIIRNVTPMNKSPLNLSYNTTQEKENIDSNPNVSTNLPQKFYSSASKVLMQESPSKSPVLPKMGEKQKAVFITPRPQILKHLGRVRSEEKTLEGTQIENTPRTPRKTSLRRTSFGHLPVSETRDLDMSVVERH